MITPLSKVSLAKMAILGALAYFISPVDLFPDFLPGGYTDDLGVLLGALVVVAIHIDAESKESARRKLHDWFGDYDVSGLKDIDEKLERNPSTYHPPTILE